MIGYISKTKQKPAILEKYNCLGYDIPGAGKIWHLDLPNVEVPAVPDKGVIKIDEDLSYFVFGRQPEPHELLRRVKPFGNPIILGDGKAWSVPMVRNVVDGTALPARLIATSDGEEKMVIKDEYMEAYKAAELAWRIIEEKNTPENPIKRIDILKLYSTILGLNYAITPYDVMGYGLYCEETCWTFYYQITDAYTWNKLLAGGNDAKK